MIITMITTILSLTASTYTPPTLVVPSDMHTYPTIMHCCAQGMELSISRSHLNRLHVMIRLPDGTTTNVTESVAQVAALDDTYVIHHGKDIIGLFDLAVGSATLGSTNMDCNILGSR